MIRAIRYSLAGAVSACLLVGAPLSAVAQHAAVPASSAAAKHHGLPKGPGSTTVIKFGIQGGNIRPWSVQISKDGSITATGVTGARQQLFDPKHALQGMVTLADAEGFFSIKKAVGCLGSSGNVDMSARYISFHTSSGTKRVLAYGTCAATDKYDQLYAVLEGAAGVS